MLSQVLWPFKVISLSSSWWVTSGKPPMYTAMILWGNSVDPDQIAPEGAFWSGSTLFAILSACFGHITLWHCLSSCSSFRSSDYSKYLGVGIFQHCVTIFPSSSRTWFAHKKPTVKTSLLQRWETKSAGSYDYGSYHIGDQRRLRRACASAQSHQSLRCSETWSMEVDERSDQKSDI